MENCASRDINSPQGTVRFHPTGRCRIVVIHRSVCSPATLRLLNPINTRALSIRGDGVLPPRLFRYSGWLQHHNEQQLRVARRRHPLNRGIRRSSHPLIPRARGHVPGCIGRYYRAGVWYIVVSRVRLLDRDHFLIRRAIGLASNESSVNDER